MAVVFATIPDTRRETYVKSLDWIKLSYTDFYAAIPDSTIFSNEAAVKHAVN
jgi:hypothetical protein